ncbi:MAG TPA: DPP IV N-terminal domain-containing protein [Balneolales bacterium]|nr:DPP IV N-terminal domain-containing protein [Balneolales bacterium]
MKIRLHLFLVLMLIAGVGQGCNSQLQKYHAPASVYKNAEKFLPENITQYVSHIRVNPNWVNNSSVFWYEVKTQKGHQFFVVNPENKSRKPLFNQQKLAESLSKALNRKIKPYDLPFHQLKWNRPKNEITVRIKGNQWVIDLNNYEVHELKHTGSQRRNNRLSSVSPNKKWIAFRKNDNLYVRNRQTGKITQLSRNGRNHLIYGATLPWAWMREVGPVKKDAKPIPLDVSWSPDSKKLFANELDLRHAKKMYLLQNVPDSSERAEVYSYYRALPGNKNVAKLIPYVFNIQTHRETRIQVPAYNNVTNYGNWMWFGNGSQKLYFIYRPRGYKSATLLEANANTGNVHQVFKETSSTYVNPLNAGFRFLPKRNEFLWLSERDGWNHIYLYNLKTGKVIRKITKGHYVVKNIDYVDKTNQKIYFTAGGVKKGEDPYFNNLCVINFDGSGMKILTPENATHDISISPDHKYFVDNYSRVDHKPTSVLRSLKDGSVVMPLEKANIKKLLAAGWHYPQPFKLKARDDSTEIYGVIFRPDNFNPNKSYPIIDGIYAGPQAVRTPKSFYRGYRNEDQALADLGFIVFTVDGLGTAQRSKKFHDYSYKNLGDIGLPDHIKAIKYLAKKYSYIDTSKVGIYGHSAGGYDAARAILMKPNFFKAALAASGDYNLRVAKAWWPELYMGYPVGPDYANQNDVKLASHLKNKLLLVHGDMDTNVHPAEIYRMANALEKAQKDFQMMIIPNYSHGITHNPFYIKLKWNFFVKNLKGKTPPANFKIELQKSK